MRDIVDCLLQSLNGTHSVTMDVRLFCCSVICHSSENVVWKTVIHDLATDLAHLPIGQVYYSTEKAVLIIFFNSRLGSPTLNGDKLRN